MHGKSTLPSPPIKEYLKIPTGWVEISTLERKLSQVSFKSEGNFSEPGVNCTEAFMQLKEYFFEGRKEFSISIELQGTDFQRKVWAELQKIPFGKTISYQELANRLGDPKSIRAAASANGKNPIPIVIPCHRVIGLDGQLTGYSGGLNNKRHLLQLEGAIQIEIQF